MADKLTPKTTRVKKNPSEGTEELGGNVIKTGGIIQWIKSVFGGRIKVVDDPQNPEMISCGRLYPEPMLPCSVIYIHTPPPVRV